MVELSAFVLAGGKSTRMGSDKAFVQIEGRTLLDRVLALARTATPNVWIVGSRDKFGSYAPTVEDIFPERGPLGGIHAALTASSTELNLMLAVDAPFVRPEFLQYLLAEASQSPAMATLPRLALPDDHQRPSSTPPPSAAPGARVKRFRSEFHPLCAVYRRGFRHRAEDALRAGNNKIDPLFTGDDIRVITASEITALGLPISMFANINTREELERVSAFR